MPLNYEEVKDFYTEKLLSDRTGRGRLESAAFHTVSFAYRKGVEEHQNLLDRITELETALLGAANALQIADEHGAGAFNIRDSRRHVETVLGKDWKPRLF